MFCVHIIICGLTFSFYILSEIHDKMTFSMFFSFFGHDPNSYLAIHIDIVSVICPRLRPFGPHSTECLFPAGAEANLKLEH